MPFLLAFFITEGDGQWVTFHSLQGHSTKFQAGSLRFWCLPREGQAYSGGIFVPGPCVKRECFCGVTFLKSFLVLYI